MSESSKEVQINQLSTQVQNLSLSSRAGGRKWELWTWVECQFFWRTLHNFWKESFPSNIVHAVVVMVFLFQTLYTSSGSPVSVAGSGCCCPWVDIESGQKTVATLLLENPKGSLITQYSGQALQGVFRTKAPPGMVKLMQYVSVFLFSWTKIIDISIAHCRWRPNLSRVHLATLVSKSGYKANVTLTIGRLSYPSMTSIFQVLRTVSLLGTWT